LVCNEHSVFLIRTTFHDTFSGFYSKQWWKKKDSDSDKLLDCTVEQLEEAIQGYFTADALPSSIAETPGISGKVLIRSLSVLCEDFMPYDLLHR
jgi:hypothetical protein